MDEKINLSLDLKPKSLLVLFPQNQYQSCIVANQEQLTTIRRCQIQFCFSDRAGKSITSEDSFKNLILERHIRTHL